MEKESKVIIDYDTSPSEMVDIVSGIFESLGIEYEMSGEESIIFTYKSKE